MIKSASPLCFLLLLLVAGCDGGNDTSGGIRSEAAVQADWNAHCDAFASCENGRDAPGCKNEYACLHDSMRPDMLDKTAACELARTCTTSDDSCYSVEVQGLTVSDVGAQFRSDCLAKLGTCMPASSAYHDDLCNGATIFKDSLVTTMAACLSKPCDQVEACVTGAFASASPACANM